MQEQGRATRTRVGKAIRRLRLQRGFSQERLAELAGNSAKHVGQIERGEVNVGIDVLNRIAVALAADVGDLFAQPRGTRRRPPSAVFAITREQIDTVQRVLRTV